MSHPDRSIRFPLAALFCALLLACSSAPVVAQTPGGIPTSTAPVVTELPDDEAAASGLNLICEVYCSETDPGTVVARLRWSPIAGVASESSGGRTVAAPREVQTTVFKDGFAKDLYLSLPLTSAVGQAGVASAPGRDGSSLRAFELRLTEVEGSLTAQGAVGAGGETIAVIENLEPGITYTWRLAGEAGDTSPAVSCQAPVCPVDLVRADEEEGPQ